MSQPAPVGRNASFELRREQPCASAIPKSSTLGASREQALRRDTKAPVRQKSIRVRLSYCDRLSYQRARQDTSGLLRGRRSG